MKVKAVLHIIIAKKSLRLSEFKTSKKAPGKWIAIFFNPKGSEFKGNIENVVLGTTIILGPDGQKALQTAFKSDSHLRPLRNKYIYKYIHIFFVY